MRILVLQPEDDPAEFAGVGGRFDQVADLGFSSSSSYERWSELIGCPMASVPNVEFSDLSRLRAILDRGAGHLIDEQGFDWWDLISIQFYEQVLEVFRLERFAARLGTNDHIFLDTRRFQARVLDSLLPGRIRPRIPFVPVRSGTTEKFRRILSLRPRQALEIVCDKYDGDYRVRALFARRRTDDSTPVVLLPSAYGNVSSTALGYAELLPDQKFLLVATRLSGSAKAKLRNVASASLGGYGPPHVPSDELQQLMSSWQRLVRREFRECRELSALLEAGCFGSVPQILKTGLAVRNAWLQVFARENICAVLCGDEMNWRTSLPMLIARSRGLPALACHHGALDLRYTFRNISASRFLAKGLMEQHYLTERCGVPAEKIEIAAPLRIQSGGPNVRYRKSIVFFSEPYENFGMRAPEVYGEILPGLAELARRNDCELVIKLHPYESLRTRKRLAASSVCSGDSNVLRVVDGPLSEELIEAAWLGVTITSTAALDCALKGVPVFLCKWLDFSNSMYAEQFVKFGAARALARPESISEIPPLLKGFRTPNLAKLWQTVSPARLHDLFSLPEEIRSSNIETVRAASVWA